ncbi:MAG: transcription termination factor NusA [Erysipelotrichaceae bacterium]|nr:transcription termination factor NusA [Erysipelotrichaceae bacterium]
MNLKDFMAAMQAIESDRKLSKEIVVEALQEALSKAFRKHIEIPDALVRVDINGKSGEVKVYQERVVVEKVEDDELEISLEDAQRVKETYQLGDRVASEVSIAELGRAAVILAKNVMKQKIREAEKQAVYDEYCDKEEEMIIGIVESVEEKFAIINIGKTLALLPKNQQIPGEKYKDGQHLRVVISEVNRETKGAQVIVSRGNATLVKRLFEKEVPEIYQGIIEIKAIARDAGERTKMAVYSHNENIDPIGACIGPKGQRVQVIIDELGGEKIDIFEWSEDVSELIKNALAPAEVLAVIPSSDRKNGLCVVVRDDQLSLAIGKKGKNARLAVKLTGSKIDIKSESDMEEAGIPWKEIALKQREEYLAKQEEEHEKAQQALFKEMNKPQEVESIVEADFHYDVDAESEKEEALQESVVEEVVEDVAEEVVEEADDFEKAAKIVKEKQKVEGINIKEKQEYVSKFETFADSSVKQEEKTVKVKYKKVEEKEEPRRKATFDLSKKDYEMKPIYSQEELDEIARQEAEEAENDWINDDIDFDEYDEYYEE